MGSDEECFCYYFSKYSLIWDFISSLTEKELKNQEHHQSKQQNAESSSNKIRNVSGDPCPLYFQTSAGSQEPGHTGINIWLDTARNQYKNFRWYVGTIMSWQGCKREEACTAEVEAGVRTAEAGRRVEDPAAAVLGGCTTGGCSSSPLGSVVSYALWWACATF